MPPRDESLRLRDMVEAMDRITLFAAGRYHNVLTADLMAIRAINHKLTIIGEAVSRVPESLRQRYPGIPWRDIRGMRNALIHQYHEADSDEVARPAIEEVPVLKAQILQVIAEMEAP